MRVLIFVIFIVNNVASYNVSDFYNLPKIFKMENYANCMNENNLYCELEFEVKSVNDESKFWKIIQNYDVQESFYDRKILFRAMCLTKLYKNDKIKLKEIGLARMKNELQSYDLDADLINFSCKLSFTYRLRDYIILCVSSLYIIWIIIATSTEYFGNNLTSKYLQYFSVIYNFKKLTTNSRTPHYSRLKFMNGVRFFCICFVVVGHSSLTYVSMYTENPEFFEELYSYKIGTLFIYFLALLVPKFFVLSGWLTVLNIYFMSNNFSKFSIQDVLSLFVNRLLRYSPIILLTYMFNSNIIFINDIPCTKLLERFVINCRFGLSYVLIQNWFYPSETCNPHFWSLSVDIQSLTILLAAFYIIIKYKFPILRSLLMLCLFFILIQSIIIYYNNIRTFFNLTPRSSLPLSRKSVESNLNYMSTIANVPSYLIGSIFGIVYLRNINNNIFKNKSMKIIWVLTTTGLVILALSLIDIPQSRLARSIFGSLLKPIYVSGVAVFLFGLAQNVSDKLRKIFEIRFIEILGKCTLSIYVIHPGICFIRSSEGIQTKIVFYELVLTIIGDIIKSILAGFVLHLNLELPFANLTSHNYREAKKKKEK